MITISHLAEHPKLGLTFIAGRQGAGRPVTWAHAVDLPDPWKWIGQGDLVMTTGAGFPASSEEQAVWMARLIEAKASGLVVALRPDAPDLSQAALQVAEDSGFSVLGASFELEFATVARVVIESALETQRHRLARSERLFSAYTELLHETKTLTERMDRLGERFGWAIEIQSEDGPNVPNSIQNPGVVRMVIPGRTGSTLVVQPRDTGTQGVVDSALVHYLAGLVGLEIEREAMDRDEARAAGEELLRGLIRGDVEYSSARSAFERRGMPDPLVAVVLRPSGKAAWDGSHLHHHPNLWSYKPPLLSDQGDLIAILPDSRTLVVSLVEALGDNSKAGISQALNPASGILEGIRQARLALSLAIESDEGVATYSSSRVGSLIPDTVAEATALAHRYLEPLFEHDRSHGTELVRTLSTFLETDRSWKKTSDQLHIHRQTLVYRMRTIEELTRVKPASTAGTAALWLALESARATGILPRWDSGQEEASRKHAPP